MGDRETEPHQHEAGYIRADVLASPKSPCRTGADHTFVRYSRPRNADHPLPGLHAWPEQPRSIPHHRNVINACRSPPATILWRTARADADRSPDPSSNRCRRPIATRGISVDGQDRPEALGHRRDPLHGPDRESARTAAERAAPPVPDAAGSCATPPRGSGDRGVRGGTCSSRCGSVDVRDFGIGIPARAFPSSIVGLNETRKLKKFFLAGAFGQGGSTALSYCSYTIIVSRSANGSEDAPAAATIVRFNPGDPDIDKHGVYEYMVDSKNGFPFELKISSIEFPPGTLVRHIAMELGKYNKIMTAPTNSLWYLAHHYLFDPVLPYRIVEERNNKSRGEDRFVGGNHRRLSQGRDTEYQREAIRTFHSGSVTITWWVLSAEGDDPRGRIYNYCLPSKPIMITYNGQKQGELPYTVIKDDLKLPYLERYLIVHIDCDRLDNESRRQLFPNDAGVSAGHKDPRPPASTPGGDIGSGWRTPALGPRTQAALSGTC